MSLIPLHDFSCFARERHPLLGVDYGTSYVGIALSDRDWMIASSLTTLREKKFKDTARRIVSLIVEHKVSGIIVGLPLHMEGGEGKQTQITRQFVSNFLNFHPISMALWDERLSTHAAMHALLPLSFAKRDKAIDKVAAAFMLQGALDFLKFSAQHRQPH